MGWSETEIERGKRCDGTTRSGGVSASARRWSARRRRREEEEDVRRLGRRCVNEVSPFLSPLGPAQVPHMQALLSIALLLVVAARAATTLQGRVDNPDLSWSTAAPICWNKRTHSPPPTESVPIDAHIVALSSRTLDERSYDLLATHSALMLSSRPSHRPLLRERHRRVCAHTAFHHDRMHSTCDLPWSPSPLR